MCTGREHARALALAAEWRRELRWRKLCQREGWAAWVGEARQGWQSAMRRAKESRA